MSPTIASMLIEAAGRAREALSAEIAAAEADKRGWADLAAGLRRQATDLRRAVAAAYARAELAHGAYPAVRPAC